MVLGWGWLQPEIKTEHIGGKKLKRRENRRKEKGGGGMIYCNNVWHTHSFFFSARVQGAQTDIQNR